MERPDSFESNRSDQKEGQLRSCSFGRQIWLRLYKNRKNIFPVAPSVHDRVETLNRSHIPREDIVITL